MANVMSFVPRCIPNRTGCIKMIGRNGGFFLVLVAAVVAALAAILVQFGVDAQLATLTSGSIRYEVVARQGAMSVLEGVKVAVAEDRWQGSEVISFISEGMSREVTCTGWIDNEEGKLPINRLIASGAEGVEILRRYWEERSCSLESLNALIDWIDVDNSTIYGEPEDSFYGKLGEIPINRSMQSIFGLSLVPFMKREMERLKKLKEPPLNRDLTVWGTGKINLLTASRDVLMALSDEITPAMVDRIIEERSFAHIKTMGDFRKGIKVPDKVFSIFLRRGTLRSTTFSTHIEASYRKVHVFLRAVLRRHGNSVSILYFREGLWQPA